MGIPFKDLPMHVQRMVGPASAAPRPGPAQPRNKYGAKKVEVDGIKFDSQREAKRYGELKLLWQAGEVAWFIMQVPFRLDGGTVYRADFLIVWASGAVTVEDAKGFKTKEYAIKKREVEAKFGIKIVEV